MIGFAIGQADLEDGQAGIDGVDQADVAGELMKEGDAAVAEAMDAVGDFVAEVAAGEDGSRACLGNLVLSRRRWILRLRACSCLRSLVFTRNSFLFGVFSDGYQ